MKLLFDENLSHHLIEALSDSYPGSTHVRNVGLEEADDQTIWSYDAEHDDVIVTKDSDFPERALVEGEPPKILWLQRQLFDGRNRESATRRPSRDQRNRQRWEYGAADTPVGALPKNRAGPSMEDRRSPPIAVLPLGCTERSSWDDKSALPFPAANNSGYRASTAPAPPRPVYALAP